MAPVAILEPLELLRLDAVEGWAGEAALDRLLTQTAGKQVNIVGRAVELAQQRPVGRGDLGGWGGGELGEGRESAPLPVLAVARQPWRS